MTGMNRRGYRLHPTNVGDEFWRARFSSALILRANGLGTRATPWRAAQQADFAGPAVDREDRAEDGLNHPGVEAEGRLVDHRQAWMEQQGDGHLEDLLLPPESVPTGS